MGVGVLFTGDLAPSPFKVMDLPPKPEQHYGEATISNSTVTDSSSFSDMIKASVTASASYSGLVASGSVNAEATYLQENAGSSTGLHLVINSKWLGKPRQFPQDDEPRLSKKVGVCASCMYSRRRTYSEQEVSHGGHSISMTHNSRDFIFRSKQTCHVSVPMTGCIDSLIGRLHSIVACFQACLQS